MATAKTTAQRQEKFKESKMAKDMKEVHNLWAHKDDHDEIKRFAKMVSDRRLHGRSVTDEWNQEAFKPIKEWLIVGGDQPSNVQRTDGCVQVAVDEVAITIGDDVVLETAYKGRPVLKQTYHFRSFGYSKFKLADGAWINMIFGM